MVKVKICGVRREYDIDFVNRYLPDYIGFIFAKSKREVSPNQARLLAKSLDKAVKKVGVFVNEDVSRIVEIADECMLDAVQVHGDETPDYVLDLKRKLGTRQEVWKAIQVKDGSSVEKIREYQADKFVLDSYTDGGYGGAGKAFEWSLAAKSKKYGSIILAGGLNPENVKEAIRTVQPYMVDVSSGVETDGWKDESKIKSFIYSVRCSMY